MIFGLIALAIAVVALVQVGRLRRELAEVRAELLASLTGPAVVGSRETVGATPVSSAVPSGAVPADPPSRRPSGAPGAILDASEYRLLEQFIEARERLPAETRDRVGERLMMRFGGRVPRSAGASGDFLLALYQDERAARSAAGAERDRVRDVAGASARAGAFREAEPADGAETDEAAAGAASPAGRPRGLDLETRVGTTWALRLGLGALAIAVALFARSVVPALPAGAKVALAYAGAAALFVVGRVFEARQERFARPVMAAALSIGFFVAFASHFVPAMRAVPLAPALAWMALSVVAVLVLAERWGSEPTAGLAIFLGHVSAFVAGGVTDVYSLVVILFLSAAAVVLLWRHDWVPLSLFAVTAAYASHLLWTLSDHGPAAAGLSLGVNLLFLASYYGIFLGADLLWWRRGAPAAPARPPALARALGPANLVLLATLATFLYLAGPGRPELLAWFLFGLGALQAALARVYRRLGNPDHVFYPALGAVLVTLGFAAALDGLSLNLVLALEAVALLLAAHHTRLRVFHFLAQAALAANFVHYWMAARYDDPVLPFYIGGLAIGAAYLTQAVLEEVWYGAEGGWRATRPSSDGPGRVASLFDRGFGVVAPILPYAHAGAGALLIAHQSFRYLGAADATLALAAGVVLLALAGLYRRSAPLVLGSATLQGAIAVLAIADPPGGTVLLALTAAGLGVPAMVAAGARVRGFEPAALRITLLVTQLAVLSALLLPLVPFASAGGAAAMTTWVGWIVAVSLAGVYLETARSALAGLETAPAPDLIAAARLGAGITAVLAAIGVIAVAERLLGATLAAPIWTTALAAGMIAAAAWRRQPAFTLGGLTLLVAGAVYWLFGLGLGDRVLESWPAMAVVAGVPIALGVLVDRVGGRRFAGARPAFAAAAAHLPYFLGSGIALAWSQTQLSAAWGSVWFAALPAALALLTTGGRERRGARVAVLLMLVAVADQLAYAAVTGASGVLDLLAPGLLLAAAALALERVLAAARAGTGTGGAGAAAPPIGPTARLALLASATLLAMATAHASSSLGGPRTTVGWSLIGGALMGLGFAARSADHRRVALLVLGLAVVRVFAVDTRGLSDTGKTVAFLALGLALVAVAWLYSRFGRRLREWL